MALWDSRTLLVGRAHRGLNATVREEAAEHDRLDLLLKLVLNQDQGCLGDIELAAALGFRGLEHAGRFGR